MHCQISRFFACYSVTNLALSIEQRFDDHEKIVKVDDTNFVCYSKLACNNGGLKIAISLKDENGALCAHTLPLIQLKTELVYEDGIPAPIDPLKPLKIKRKKIEKGKIVRSVKPIFDRVEAGEPALGKGQHTTLFAFLIEEVSYHHHGHEGFKVKVSIEGGQNLVIHPAVMKELIVVLSKPKKVQTMEGWHTILSAAEDDRVLEGDKLKPKLLTKQGVKLNTAEQEGQQGAKKGKVAITNMKDDTPKSDSDPAADVVTSCQLSISIGAILEAYKCNGKCFRCSAPVDSITILKAYYHSIDCAFAGCMLPFLQGVDPSLLKKEDEGSIAAQFNTILESKSFEEICIEYVANSPCEMIDESIFAPDTPIRTNHLSNAPDSAVIVLIPNVEGNKQTPSRAFDEYIFAPRSKASTFPTQELMKNPFVPNHRPTTLYFDEADDDDICIPDEIISGANIFDVASFTRANASEPGTGGHAVDDFLCFLDHLARGENNILNGDTPESTKRGKTYIEL